MILSYQRDRGNTLLKPLHKRLHNLLPNHVNTQVTYTGKKLSTYFNIKNRTKFEHQDNIVYHGKCPEVDCRDSYIGEASRRVFGRIIDPNGRDRKSHLFRHSVEHNHKNVERQDFKILGKGYRNNAMKQKISEALYCREFKSTLKVQEKSIDLKLFNCFSVDANKYDHHGKIYCTTINFKLLLDLFDIVFLLVNTVRTFYSVDDF